ncbi:hypothetical protein [Synechococcus sp. C9]|uniref:hypothetical protein n=1 Tax=Synechococcus sp. C9 TaxID=102119 RepID=UPI001FF42026|nr:hypothetical protein [Synechococcus sp. C9]
MALFTLRELDFDKKLGIIEVFNSRFYVSHSLPLTARILALVSLGLVVYIVIFTLYRHSQSFLLGLKRGSRISQGVLIVMVLLFLSNFIDVFVRKLNRFGVTISPATFVYFDALEEILELGMAIFIFLTIDTYFRHITAPRIPGLPTGGDSR